MSEADQPQILHGVGEALRRLRLNRGLSQKELQERTRTAAGEGVSTTAISRVELGKDYPNWRTVDRLLVALGVGREEFFHTLREVQGDVSAGPVTPEPHDEDFFLVWRIGGAERQGRDPAEVRRRMRELVDLAAAVRESFEREHPPEHKEDDDAERRRQRR